ncbi:MAG: cupin domain-containing protein [Planctomycetes bacterium]|nr:cupin domain-containing protein [Planctomycetota bacterium]MCB9829986.1 cupin domain-containing protein [Planctomycetota bacterium]MCB9900678.1 cupin domain-containing protein [Planctomycetota bacterium]
MSPRLKPLAPMPTKVVPKAWGEEHWIVNREYCGKKMILKQGYRCSMHFHKDKDEVFYVVSGRILLELGDGGRVMGPGDHHHIPVGVEHRFWGIEDAEIMEFSTHHRDEDSYRVPGQESGAFEAAELAERLEALASA